LIGTQLAHYKITARLGAGGMGEVYRATDSRLGREVALKLILPAFVRDQERMARFRREAQVLASLNHPHIAAIYGIEDLEHSKALVLELVEGPTLGERIREGAIPVADVLPIALQIAQAIEAAHEKGIIHRDLKPSNVKLTPEGRVKVLDFGLAKAFAAGSDTGTSAAAEGSRDSFTVDSPTITSPVVSAVTGPHVILGTAAYMSPEQARGQPLDKRTDIWSFGVILFEMLTGRRLFVGETVSDTLAAVLKTDPNWNQLPAETPARIRHLLRSCLARNSKERLRDAGDARLVLQEAIAGAPDETATGVLLAAPEKNRRWLLPLAALLAALAGLAAGFLLRPSLSPAPLRKFAIPMPKESKPQFLSLSPSGSKMVWVRDGKLEVHDFATLEVRILDGTNGAKAPFWSPDENWIAYGKNNDLRKVRASGGESSLITHLGVEEQFSSASGGTWGTDDHIVFATGHSGLLSVSAQGGDAVEIVKLKEGESDFHNCTPLPGKKGWIVVVHGPRGFGTLVAIDSKGRRHDLITLEGQSIFHPVFSPSGHIVYRRTGSGEGVWAFPFSPSKLERTGDPFLIASDGQFPTVSSDGTLAYMTRAVSKISTLAFADRTGKIIQKIGQPGEYIQFPSLSPDGKQILTPVAEGDGGNLWIVDVDRGTRKRMTNEKEFSFGFWDPNGQRIWYSTGITFSGKIFMQSASGIGDPKEVTSGVSPMATADGSRLFFTRGNDAQNDANLWTLDLKREGAEPQEFLATEKWEMWASPSPTDPLLAYLSNSSGDFQVFLTTYPEMRNTWLVSTGRGAYPCWRGDGRELFFCAGDSILAVDVDPGDGTNPHLGSPQLLFERESQARSPSFGSFPSVFDVSADGQRFVVYVAEESNDQPPPQAVVAQNWFEEFRRK